jgi:hypothetical protein
MAKTAKMMLAMRSPVFCELMLAFLRSLYDLSATNWRYVGRVELADSASAEGCGLHQDPNDRQADK